MAATKLAAATARRRQRRVVTHLVTAVFANGDK
jgi:hypothetical protein